MMRVRMSRRMCDVCRGMVCRGEVYRTRWSTYEHTHGNHNLEHDGDRAGA